MTIVYGVHAVRAHELEPIHVVLSRLDAAEGQAQAVSGDTGVLAGAVTSDDRRIHASAVRKVIQS